MIPSPPMTLEVARQVFIKHDVTKVEAMNQ